MPERQIVAIGGGGVSQDPDNPHLGGVPGRRAKAPHRVVRRQVMEMTRRKARLTHARARSLHRRAA